MLLPDMYRIVLTAMSEINSTELAAHVRWWQLFLASAADMEYLVFFELKSVLFALLTNPVVAIFAC